MPQIELPNGRRLKFSVRSSGNSKSVRLKVTPRGGLQVTAPLGLPASRVLSLVAGKAEWVAERIAELDQVRHLFAASTAQRPQAFDLPALAETWRVEYVETRAKTIGARTFLTGRVEVFGAVGGVRGCEAALRRWLARRAKEVLAPRLKGLAEETGLTFSDVAIKGQRTRWGSCSRNKRITLNYKLLFLPPDLVRYVLVHELCHTAEHNHSQRFWALIRHHEPDADLLHRRMREGWKYIPPWAQPAVEGAEL
jgi:predicted metal-dependent hydrolase